MPEKQYKVGYAKPPAETRFKKGKSGNPKGRPKGSRNLSSILDEALEQKVIIRESGKPREVSKLEAMVLQLVNKAAQGDHRAMQSVLGMVAVAQEKQQLESPEVREIDKEDKKVLDGLITRLRHAVTTEAGV